MDDLNAPTYNQPNEQGWQQKVKIFFTVPKIIFTVLGIIVLIELIYGIKTVSLSVTPPAAKTNITASAARISLTTPKTSPKVNEIIPVSVLLDTALYSVGGVDVIVHYDPKILEAAPADLVRGKIFNEYPVMSVDSDKGLIAISGISSKNGFAGTGQFAVINLRAKIPGKASLTIDFKKDSTTDSNLVELNTTKDILGIVDNLNLEAQ